MGIDGIQDVVYHHDDKDEEFDEEGVLDIGTLQYLKKS